MSSGCSLAGEHSGWRKGWSVLICPVLKNPSESSVDNKLLLTALDIGGTRARNKNLEPHGHKEGLSHLETFGSVTLSTEKATCGLRNGKREGLATNYLSILPWNKYQYFLCIILKVLLQPQAFTAF